MCKFGGLRHVVIYVARHFTVTLKVSPTWLEFRKFISFDFQIRSNWRRTWTRSSIFGKELHGMPIWSWSLSLRGSWIWPSTTFCAELELLLLIVLDYNHLLSGDGITFCFFHAFKLCAVSGSWSLQTLQQHWTENYGRRHIQGPSIPRVWYRFPPSNLNTNILERSPYLHEPHDEYCYHVYHGSCTASDQFVWWAQEAGEVDANSAHSANLRQPEGTAGMHIVCFMQFP